LSDAGLSEMQINAMFDQEVVFDQYRDRSQMPHPNT